MARTAPAPDIPPIPGMCPSIAVLAGGGDAGGGSGGSAGDGSGDNNAGAGKGGENAEADSRGAPDYEKYPECGYASHPVDVVTGRAFTHPIVDVELPGPLPLRFARMYSSKMAGRDVGLGFGWGHTFGWEIEVGRRQITVWNEQGVGVDFPMIRAGDEVIGPWGWVLRRETWGFAVDADDGLWHLFSAAEDEGKRWRLTALEDRNRNRIALTYEDGRLVEVKDSAGRILRFTATREGRVGSIQVQNAISQGQWIAFATYTYDDRGNLAAATDADGHTARYEYDEDHRLTADTDRAGLCFHFVYDREGRCVESWGDYPGKRDPSLGDAVPKYLHDGKTRAKGIHHCKFEYGPDGYTEVVDSTQARRFFGTKHGTLKKSVTGGGVTTAVYRDDGHMLSRSDALGATVQFDRDARGRILMVTDALGRVTSIGRDAAGLPITVTDPAGGVTTITRDAHGNVLTQADPLGGVTAYRYDERGLLVELITPRGAKTTFTRDAQGNLAEVVEPGGATWRFKHDAFGRRVSQLDPLGAETRYAYSARGDLVAVYDAAGGVTRYTYDGEGHVTQVVDPGGAVTTLTWGGYHKLSARRDGNGNEVRLAYDLEGELLGVRNERGEEHRFTYDSAGRLVAEAMFDGRVVTYKNDALGRPIRITDGLGNKTTLTYDLAGQLVARELGDGSKESFEHDALGRIVAASRPGCEVRFERDAVGRIVREIVRVGDDEETVESAYDADGNRVSRTTSRGHVEVMERDASGTRRRTVLDGDHAIEHAHDALGRETSRILPRGGRLDSAYDALGRLTQRRAFGPSSQRRVGAAEPAWIGPQEDNVRAATAYRYDAGGQVVEIWDRWDGRTELQYDPIGQLLARLPEKARREVFRFDAAGNAHEAGIVHEYGAGNRLERKGAAAYQWNDAGQLVEKRVAAADGESTWTYRWNGAGLLEAVTAPDGTLVELAYDALARRVQKRVSRPGPSGTPVPVALTRFVWDGDVLVHELRTRAEAGGDPIVEERTYCFEDDTFAPFAHRDARRADGSAGDWFHYANDPAGAPERLIDAAGDVACELTRAAWGHASAEPGGRTSTPIRLQGQYEDEETGLAYNRYRYYDPDAGRFVSADPIGLGGGHHLYAFAPNPLAWVDPYGTAKADRSWTRTNTAAGQLPRFSGRSPAYVRRACTDAGFRQDPQNPNHWIHPDGSRVRIDSPHNPARGPANGGYRGDVETHYHKEWQDPYGNPWNHLDDRGRINSDPNRTHIIGRGRP